MITNQPLESNIILSIPLLGAARHGNTTNLDLRSGGSMSQNVWVVVGPLVKTEVRGFLGTRAVAKLLPQSTRNVVVTWLVGVVSKVISPNTFQTTAPKPLPAG